MYDNLEDYVRAAIDMAQKGHTIVRFRYFGRELEVTPKHTLRTFMRMWNTEASVKGLERVNRREELRFEYEEKLLALNRSLLLEDAPVVLTAIDPMQWGQDLARSKECDGSWSLHNLVDVWGRLMEVHMANGFALEDVIREDYLLADTLGSGQVVPHAQALLVDIWVHGDAVRTWIDKTGGILGNLGRGE